jgi:hypothetical protein
MKLLKIIAIIFLIHFIRRFIQMYRAVQDMQKTKDQARPASAQNSSKTDVINADYRVVD